MRGKPKETINRDGSISETRVKKPFYKKTWFIIIVAFILLGSIISALGGGDDDDTANAPQQVVEREEEKSSEEIAQEAEEAEKAKAAEEARNAEEEKKAEEEAKRIKSGTYKIGSDLPAGEYKIFSNGFTYLEVAKDSSGTLDSIITNDNISTFKYVTVEDGQYLQFNDGYAMAVEDIEPYLSSDGSYGEGQYKVGFDIPAGEYNVVADGDFAYIEVAANSTGDIFSIITNDNFDTNKYVSISEGQYFTITRGKIE